MDVTEFTHRQLRTLRRIFHVMNHFMVFMWRIGLGRVMNIWPAVIGRIMIIKHRGRRTGREHLTPVNYAVVEGEVYCASGFGSLSDWYRNLLAHPRVALWLPEGWRRVQAEDVSSSRRRLFLLRQIIVASGFAGPLFGVNPHRLDDMQLDAVSKDYRLIHFIQEK